MAEVQVKRRRRTAEERLADLEAKRQQMEAKLREQLAKIDEEKRRLAGSPSLRKAQMENQKRFERAVQEIAPDLDHRHFIAIIADAVESGFDTDAMADRGESLLQEHGKARRGRRPRSAA
ncbi:hypothetical protein [Acidithiobacillus caldus]|uniref:Uncharacterized protein n=1 Tax=Acidithiobacillus caldus (strain ATCC 51756 / DSM 8584 / KU) TaxID=637389 RepID=A0A059ZS00_ACICK|nr:hypothetical protein [Acidithiobacillus caldus]AIA55639.1 hypothetical protein Acaty_c1780 [Acidithiobacillus caldus ATCC 51756]MBU2729328.1 hypothetical protein [Acidithiobacillus caldus]MBU2735165.1 hypothetical protein [Acidithiobacillus caldus ATCC 51756]MBU2744095.1 hypothetical protein [Acidithiobacillus caldus]MBU2778770.1 hypothetical protein [Acidithiobacillus caldus]